MYQDHVIGRSRNHNITLVPPVLFLSSTAVTTYMYKNINLHSDYLQNKLYMVNFFLPDL